MKLSWQTFYLLRLNFQFFMRVGYGAVSFISKYEGKYYKEGTDNNLCIRTPSGSTGIDDSELVHNDDDQ